MPARATPPDPHGREAHRLAKSIGQVSIWYCLPGEDVRMIRPALVEDADALSQTEVPLDHPVLLSRIVELLGNLLRYVETDADRTGAPDERAAIVRFAALLQRVPTAHPAVPGLLERAERLREARPNRLPDAGAVIEAMDRVTGQRARFRVRSIFAGPTADRRGVFCMPLDRPETDAELLYGQFIAQAAILDVTDER